MNVRAGRRWRLRFLAAGAMLIALQPSPAHAFSLPATCRDQRPLTTEETKKPAPKLRHYIDAIGEQDPTTAVRIMCGTLPRVEREYGGRSLELARWAQMLATPLIAYLDRHDEALPLLEFAQPILERELGAISPEVSEIHVAYAWVAFRRGLLAEAGAHWERALHIRERIPGPRKIELQKVLVGLAQVRLAQREFAAARVALDRAHAILVENHAAVSEAGAAIENAYGQLAIREENFAEARRHVESQVDIEFELSRRAGPGQDVPQPVTALVTLGMVLERLDEFDQAEQALRRAVRIAESAQGPPQRQYLPAYTQLGILLNSRGKPAEALPFAERAVEVGNSTIGPDAPRMVRVLQSLGEVQRSLGELPQALRTYERAGGIVERHRADVERQTLVAYYGGLGNLHLALGAPEDATRALATGLAAAGEEPTLATERATLLVAEARIVARRAGPGARALLEEALALFRSRLPERHPIMLRVVNELCGVEVAAGTPGTPSCADAMTRLQQSQTVDPGLRADTFESLSRADEAHGDTRGAIDHAVRAVSAASTLGTPDPMWHAQFQLARLLRKDAQDGHAIFFGKQAITEVERERAWLRGDDARLQPGFLADKIRVYRAVADWLMEAGRMDEALEVLGLLKSEELRDFVVRGETLQGDRATIGLTMAEQLMLDAYTRLLVTDRTAGAQIDELSALRESSRITPEERLRLESLLTGQEQAEIVRAARIRSFLDVGRAAPTTPSATLQQVRAGRLDREVQRLGADSALAVYLLTEDRVRILVATRREQREYRVPVDAPALRRDIGRLLDAIVARQDVMPLSQSLYRTLLAPVDEAARRAGAKHLVVWPDGALRYVPFAALHDGRRYVIERYSVSLYGDTGQRPAGEDAPPLEVTVRGLGVTRAVAGYEALPAMADELCSVVRGPIEGLKSSSKRCTGPSSSAGALSGEGYADAAFTEGRLKTVLDERGRFSVLHLGTHFDLRPGNAVRSFLVLGDGSRLTLDRISQLDFRGIELVTLSACQTALGGAVTDEGREIEGLSTIIQRRGASHVIASLWKVEDGSTAALMSALYGSLAHPGAATAEALQHAQVELIHPRWPAGSPYAHPYYWAGFTLVSNRP